MKYMLDANILIHMLSFPTEPLLRRLGECDEGDLATSAVAFAEVAFGSVNGKPPPLQRLHVMAEEVSILPFDQAAARAYSELPFRRGSYDRLIAAHALSVGLPLVTDNVAHFGNVPGLRVENWMAD